MIVLTKSGPHTAEGKRALTLAKDASANMVLVQNGVYFTQSGLLDDFGGSVFAIQEDVALRGLENKAEGKNIKYIDWDVLTDMLAGDENVVGMF